MRSPLTRLLLALAALVLAGILFIVGADRLPVHLRADQRPAPIGRGPGYAPSAVSAAVARRAPVRGKTCTRARARGATVGVHLELFARRLVLPVPAGIGIAPPQQRRGAYVVGGACVYPMRTYEPTGVVVVDAGVGRLKLGDLFAVWGQPLTRRSLAGFTGSVSAFVGGGRWTGAPGSIPLRRHAEIVLEVAGFVAPHPSYRFPPGL